MVKITTDYLESPIIGKEIKKIIENLENPDDFVLSLQLDYRENNTIFYLKKVEDIEFKADILKVVQENNTHAFFKYQNILEYCVLNTVDVIDVEEVIC